MKGLIKNRLKELNSGWNVRLMKVIKGEFFTIFVLIKS